MNNKATTKDWDFCYRILPDVSRTFAINIGYLEGDILRTVLIGYLLFRIADTFEDNLYRTEREKIDDLKDFARIFKGNKSLEDRIELFEALKYRWKEQSPEKRLIEEGHRVLKCYFDIPSHFRKIIDPLIVESVQGMMKFQSLKLNSDEKIYQLKNLKELEDYCYYVAGIVGIMLTRVFCTIKDIKANQCQLERYQVQFGLALQMVNITKDYEKDLSRGWCYIPSSITRRYRIAPEGLRHLTLEQKKGMLQDLSRRIIQHLDSSLRYIKSLPLQEESIRSFCIIPFVLAYNTLKKIVLLDGNKLTREEVNQILKRQEAFVRSNTILEKDYLKIKRLIRLSLTT